MSVFPSCPLNVSLDLLGDFVTLFCWKLSRKPPSERYPYGFGKFEVLGTTTVSILLTAGAVGIGMHSWSLLADSLSQMATTLPAGPIHDVVVAATGAAQSIPTAVTEHVHVHSHSHSHALDPNAAWFAAISVIAKEWLYRATKRVADDERSPVLLANAVHHRSDAYSSLVALVAILGSWSFPHLPLDPIGGASFAFLCLPSTNLASCLRRSLGVRSDLPARLGHSSQRIPATDRRGGLSTHEVSSSQKPATTSSR